MSSALDGSDLGAKAEMLDLLLTATQDGVVDWHLASAVVTYNARWRHLLGFDDAADVDFCEAQEAWREMMHDDDRPRALKLIDDHLKQGWPLYTTVRMRHRHGGYRHMLVRGAAHRDALDKPLRMVLIFSDIDERIRGEERQRGLEDRLLQAQKLSAIGQLAAGVAHEINTPMQFVGDNLHFAQTAIADLLRLLDLLQKTVAEAAHAPASAAKLAELAQAELDLDFEFTREALPTAIERCLTGVERVTKIVRAMRAFAHPDGDRLTPTDLKGLIESTVMVATNEWKYVAEMELDLDANLPPVPCIGGELNQVVLNLIVNASHAIADVVGSSGNKGKISISAQCDATHAEIRVRDSGTGIPEHARAKVFEPFFTTKEVGKGTGQGLAMAYSSIVTRHKGTIDFETELGSGTTFVIRLPLQADKPQSGAPP